jgi:hypothetical protein
MMKTRLHPTHAMNPIDRAFMRDDEQAEPPERYKFRCLFCGALDTTDEAAAPCRWGAIFR